MGLAVLGTVTIIATIGYMVLGLGFFDALYQTVITVGTVGYLEVGKPTTAFRAFTIVVILAGVGSALYTFTVLMETLIEGRLTDVFWRKRMERDIAGLVGHTIICGYGRTGSTIAHYLANAGRAAVVIDNDPDRLEDCPYPFVEGEATEDAVLEAAGLARADALVATLDTDAGNLYVTLSARAARPDLFIVARAHVPGSEPKLAQAGANRVVNPQQIGGARMAALTLQPHVADFLDVVMHDGSLEFRIEEVTVPSGSPLVGCSLRDAQIRDHTGAMVIALRSSDGEFLTNPGADTVIGSGQTLIAIGTREQLAALDQAAHPTGRP
jgi:voltage-gated potassium channel